MRVKKETNKKTYELEHLNKVGVLQRVSSCGEYARTPAISKANPCENHGYVNLNDTALQCAMPHPTVTLMSIPNLFFVRPESQYLKVRTLCSGIYWQVVPAYLPY
jgi:hypothetical protein